MTSAIMKAVAVCMLVTALLGCKIPGGFESHIQEAIDIYEVRSKQYSILTGGESDKIFNTLIFMEKAMLPVARAIDYQAKKFNDDGIMVVTNDFVPMTLKYTAFDYIHPSNGFNDSTEHLSKSWMSKLRTHINSSDFKAIAYDAQQALNAIDLHEQEFNVHLPMLKHLVESIGYGALHAYGYACESNNQTTALSKRLLSVQLLVLNDMVWKFDQQANVFHQQGIGVLVNDLPPIPFLKKINDLQEQAFDCASFKTHPAYMEPT